MPISDGYETCKNIVNLYNESNKIFKTVNKKQDLQKLSQIDDAIGSKSQENLHNKDLKPKIVAVTSEILDADFQKTLKEIEFDASYEAPMKDAIIKTQIIPMLQNRRALLSEKN